MKYRKDLKIEFRAVPYGTASHVLEYRISPDQDINYKKEYSFLGLKFYLNKKFDTRWKQPTWFKNYSTKDIFYKEDRCWVPIFIHSKKILYDYKTNYKTIGEFYDYIDKHNAAEKQVWENYRKLYLDERNIWS